MSSQENSVTNKNKETVVSVEDCLVLGRYHLILALAVEFIIIAELSNMVFMVFGGAAPTIVSCGNFTFAENFTNQVEVCRKIDDLLIGQNYSCKPRVREVFGSINYEWNLLCEREKLIKNCVSIQMLGVMIGAALFGQLSDLFGRKWTAILTLTCLMTAGASSSFSPNFLIFTILRFVIGFFLGGTMTVVYVFFVEHLPFQYRILTQTLLSWSPNYALFSVLAYFAREWRRLALVSNALALPSVILLILLKESPRWLVQRGRAKEAQDVLQSITRINRYSIGDQQLKTIVQNEMAKSLHLKKQKFFFLHHLCSSWKLTGYTLAMSVTWFTTSAVSYGILFNLGRISGSIYWNSVFFGLIRYGFSIFVALLDYFFVRIGRRVIQTAALTIISICFCSIFLIKLLDLSQNWVSLIRVLSLCAAGMTSPLWMLAYLLTAELYPTAIRNLANGHSSLWARIGGVVAPQIFHLADIWPASPYLVMAILCLVDLGIFLGTVPETKGKPLPEHMPNTATTSSLCEDVKIGQELSQQRQQKGNICKKKSNQMAEQSERNQSVTVF